MGANLPDEIKDKLKILEKEEYFFKRIRMWAPSKWDIPTVILGVICILMLSILAAGANYYISPFVFILVIIFIVNQFKLRKLYMLYSNACDIIEYYKKRDKTKTQHRLVPERW